MKIVLFVFIFLSTTGVFAQLSTSPEVELTKEQKWLLEKTEKFYQLSETNISVPAFLKNLKHLMTTNDLCKSAIDRPDVTLDGSRIDENTTLLKWNVISEQENAEYVIERRYQHPYGKFDSIGVIRGGRAAVAHQSYHFADANDFPGITWYRLRRVGESDEVKPIKISGYNNQVKVSPNPASSGDISVELSKFKTDGSTSLLILDTRGRVVYANSKAFLNGSKLLKLQHLRLATGTYHVKVTNKINRGSTTFIVQ
ncbi:MAG TPA: T9SS type A sorting domain-containing protein [Flavitalea sp.]|nr:T9SS type A sorting domain-containing protein [Flavitalea sp.]